MARVFLDTNVLMDFLGRKNPEEFEYLMGHDVFVSPLSFHILCYITKTKIPNPQLTKSLERFRIVNFSFSILKKALSGPTSDLEDNIQLHSSAEAEADYFITRDKNLLDMKFFGKAEIAGKIK